MPGPARAARRAGGDPVVAAPRAARRLRRRAAARRPRCIAFRVASGVRCHRPAGLLGLCRTHRGHVLPALLVFGDSDLSAEHRDALARAKWRNASEIGERR